MTNIGKPYEGKPHVRFDEEGLGSPALHSSPLHCVYAVDVAPDMGTNVRLGQARKGWKTGLYSKYRVFSPAIWRNSQICSQKAKSFIRRKAPKFTIRARLLYPTRGERVYTEVILVGLARRTFKAELRLQRAQTIEPEMLNKR